MTTVLSPTAGNLSDTQYSHYLAQIVARFAINGESANIFTTDAPNLWEVFIGALPEHEKPFHQCHSCRRFIQSYGALVVIDENGNAQSALWNETDAYELYKPSIRAMLKVIKKAKVTGVFVTSDKRLGENLTGNWCHFHAYTPAHILHKSLTKTAYQVAAEKREDFKNVCVALTEFKPDVVKEALRVIASDALYRSEKIEGQAKWLNDLHSATASKVQKNNIVWRAVASAPAGFCHPRSSMIGTLLEDIAAGLPFDDVSKRFAAKMHPLQYQRPQVAPSTGTIAQAEKIMQQLGAAGSLARRFLRVDEVEALWHPRAINPETPSNGSVFGHLKPKEKASALSSLNLPAITMTWDKFSKSVLPTADKIEIYLGYTENFTTLVTAVNSDAPPILQWDTDEDRNPVSWYLWNGGSSASQYGLKPNNYSVVSAITKKPCEWGSREYKHQGRGLIFIIEGAQETKSPSGCLFPEILKSELHGIRSVIEAYSRNTTLEGLNAGPHATGPMYVEKEAWNARLKVTTDGQSQSYIIDRWD